MFQFFDKNHKSKINVAYPFCWIPHGQPNKYAAIHTANSPKYSGLMGHKQGVLSGGI